MILASIAVGILTGGTASSAAVSNSIGAGFLSASAGYVAGAAVGASFGAVTGAGIGASAAILSGGEVGRGAIEGGSLGFIAGALGGLGGTYYGMGLSEVSGTVGGFIHANYISIGLGSLALPVTGQFKFPLPTALILEI